METVLNEKYGLQRSSIYLNKTLVVTFLYLKEDSPSSSDKLTPTSLKLFCLKYEFL